VVPVNVTTGVCATERKGWIKSMPRIKQNVENFIIQDGGLGGLV